MSEYLTEEQAQDLAAEYCKLGEPIKTQEIIDSGAVPELKGFTIISGKVSDSIRGGNFTYYDKKAGEEVEAENPPMTLKSNGRDARGLVRTDRISTHDKERGPIPFKDQILAVGHNRMLERTKRAFGSSQVEIPGLKETAGIILAENMQVIPVEFVMRMYMAKSSTDTSMYQHYVVQGIREFCGHELPEGLVTNGKLPYLMDTPSTKDPVNDVSVSPEELVAQGYCTPEQYQIMKNMGIHGWGIADEVLRRKGLILVDTKLEFGIDSEGRIKVVDEVFTQDSSRFWKADNYDGQLEQLARGEIETLAPISFSKELARGMAKGDDPFTEEEKIIIGGRYIVGAQHLQEEPFNPDMRPREERVIEGLQKIVEMVDIN